MIREEISYDSHGKVLEGYLCHNEGITHKRPGIVIAHAWYGLDDFAKAKAEQLARLGYVALAADIYGIGRTAETDEEADQLMAPLFLDRAVLQERIVAAYEQLKAHPLVDPKRVGAIGFCFGGLTVIELLRSGVDVAGVVSFHGVLGDHRGEQTAKTVPISPKASGRILLLHGHNDPLVTSQDIHRLQNELTASRIDWQMVIYGHTSHAFTNPWANNTAAGLVYQEAADRRSWQAMQAFFSELFSGL
jgi:dienelactone hydrolase